MMTKSVGSSDGAGLFQSHAYLLRVGWPMFMASSWTWGIGMYLPVLLHDLYGWGGVAAFAVPNLIGIAFLGHIMRRRERSSAMIAGHRFAMSCFSLITVWFHVYFLTWVLTREVGGAAAFFSAPISLLMLAAAFLTTGLSDRTFIHWGVGTWAVSVLCLVYALGQWSAGGSVRPVMAIWTDGSRWGGLELAPILAAGFLACPPFDLTLQRAFRAMCENGGTGGEREARRGCFLFASYFAVMIAFTCVYAISGIRQAIVWHLFAQSMFTMSAHLRELRVHGWPVGGQDDYRRLLWLGAGGLVAVVAAVIPIGDYHYLWWLGFYGIIFPAYAVFKILPRWSADPEGSWPLCIVFCAMGLLLLARGVYGRDEWMSAIPPVLLLLWGLPYLIPSKRTFGSGAMRA